ncbi:MAG: penicillin-binding protein 1A [Halanaerobiales bacterium]
MALKKKQYIIAIIILVFALGFGMTIGALAWIIRDTPDISNYKGSGEASFVYSADGELLTKIYKENRIYVPLERIPEDLKNAIVAVEDTNFYVHHGIDFWGIIRALTTNILKNRTRPHGASTITQQLAGNAMLDRQNVSYYRKIQEAYLALQFERLYTKPEILEMYLNEIFLGHSSYGVETASQQYFDKHVWELNLSESALLAGLPRAPNFYSPIRNKEAAINRRNIVLNRMEELGYISEEEFEEAKDQEIKIKSSEPDQEDTAPYFVRYVKEQLIDRFGSQMVYNGGLKVYTTLDMDMQKKAEESVEEALDDYIPSVERDNSTDKLQPQLALSTIDPGTGAVRAMIGGRGNDQFNRATQATRQPGSAFKPFVYTTAIRQDYSTGTVINDMPMLARKEEGESKSLWPTNSQNQYRGYVSLRTALTHSINVAAVKTIQDVGISDTIDTAASMGINTIDKDNYSNDHLSLALGGLSRGVKPIEMASAYGVLANNGIRVEPYVIDQVKDNQDNTIYEAHSDKEIIMNEEDSYIMTDILKSVITNGTGWRANLDKPAAGKTGTTNDYTDAWFVGYTPDLVTSVWIGEDNPRKMVYDEKYDDGNYIYPEGEEPRTISSAEAARLWGGYMRKVVEDRPNKDFQRPENIEEVKIDPVTGLLATEDTPNPRKEIFRAQNVPEEEDDLHGPVEKVKIDTESGYLATDNCPQGQVETQTFVEESGYRLGPTTIEFEQDLEEVEKTEMVEEELEEDDEDIIKGTYIVEEGEPVQKIDPETGVPERDEDGQVIYETKPTRECPLHNTEEESDNIFDQIRNFLNKDNEQD